MATAEEDRSLRSLGRTWQSKELDAELNRTNLEKYLEIFLLLWLTVN